MKKVRSLRARRVLSQKKCGPSSRHESCGRRIPRKGSRASTPHHLSAGGPPRHQAVKKRPSKPSTARAPCPKLVPTGEVLGCAMVAVHSQDVLPIERVRVLGSGG